MRIPSKNLESFVRDLVEACTVSQQDRTVRNNNFRNFFLYGADNPNDAAVYNKTFAYLDDLNSLLYSPVSLRFTISNDDVPNLLETAKGKAAATRLRSMARQSDLDTKISEAVLWSLIKGKTIIKQTFKRGQLCPELVQPETFGVFQEAHTTLDEDMEAFSHSMLITPYQFERLIWNHPDRDLLRKRARRYANEGKLPRSGTMQVTTGGLYPFQPAGSSPPNTSRGIVDWMSAPAPTLSPTLQGQLLQLDELWVWDDRRQDWTTFQIIGDDMLIMGKYVLYNALAWDTATMTEVSWLKGHHPFVEFAPNQIDGYFWGRSEITNIALLQESINARINGTNRILRMQEDPPKRFIGSSGVNQNAVSRFSKPGGYWTDSNPNARVDQMAPDMPGDLWGSLHEYERMFDEMGGLPPLARGAGHGIRSGAHADSVIRMFSPRFKDRALVVERNVAALASLSLDLAKAHVPDRLTAWVPKEAAGLEAAPPNPLIPPPAEGLTAVNFRFADLDPEMTVSVDSHSASPAFAADAKNLMFDLFKIGAASAADVVEHTDAPDPEGLVAGITRRDIAKSKAAAEELKVKATKGR